MGKVGTLARSRRPILRPVYVSRSQSGLCPQPNFRRRNSAPIFGGRKFLAVREEFVCSAMHRTERRRNIRPGILTSANRTAHARPENLMAAVAFESPPKPRGLLQL